jgi:peptide/nickel transport system substrate-binding protein
MATDAHQRRTSLITVSLAVLLPLLLSLPPSPARAETPIRGGEFVYVVPASDFPSTDGHREETYAVIHPLAPFYSLLIKTNPGTGTSR